MTFSWTRIDFESGAVPFLKKWLIISLLIHLCAAFFSAGFYQHDEHYQIIELANYLLGGTQPSALSWEFHQQMRPWLQPLLYAGLAQGLKFFGLNNPIYLATAFRLFSALVGWLSISVLCLCGYLWLDQERMRRWLVRSFVLLWFVPFIHARTSAENLGGALFFIALGCFSLQTAPLKLGRRDFSYFSLLNVGFLFGLAFVLRFQVALMIVGFGLWYLLIARLPLRGVVGLVFGFSGAFFIGALCDRIGYGHWVLTPWNYYRLNIIQDISSQFSREPWWRYFGWGFEFLPPLSGLILISAIVGCIRRPSHVLVWSVLSYFFIHVLIPNKDIRFLFPILPAVPLLCAFGIPLGWVSIRSTVLSPRIRLGLKWVSNFLIAENTLMLILICFRPACLAIPFYSYIYSNFPEGIELYTTQGDPYIMLDLKLSFYLPKNYVWQYRGTFQEIETVMEKSKKPIYLYNHGLELPPVAGQLRVHCRERYRTFPVWIKYLNVNGWLSRSRPWMLYECSKELNL